MFSNKRDSILKAGLGSLALAAATLTFSPMASAQAMGEYGAVVGNSAGSAVAAPKAQLPSIPETSVQGTSAGTSTTEIKEEDSSPADARASDTGSGGKSDDQWTEVKGSDDDH
jgi:hypothetical protein